LLDYENVPPIIGMVISSGKATLRECQEYYSLEDIYGIAEVLWIDAHNRRILMKSPPEKD
jgi:hypothetical protein